MKGINRNVMKYIAMAAMLVDHIGMFFISAATPLGAACRVVGRLTAPVMCFFIAEGFRYTHSRRRYALRLSVFAVLSQFPYAYAHYGTLLVFDFNVMFTLLAGFLSLVCLEKIKQPLIKWLAVVALIFVTYPCDWGIFGPLWIVGFYKAKDKVDQTVFFCIVAAAVAGCAVAYSVAAGVAWYGELWQCGLFLFVPLLWLYNGERGSAHSVHKWLFYLFYPLHLALLLAVKILLN